MRKVFLALASHCLNVEVTLELAFANKSLRKLCESEALAARQFGLKVAAQLTGRLADLRAAQCVRELVAGNPCELDGSLHGHMAINLCDGYRIVFCTNHCTNRDLSTKVNWPKVTRVKIVEIERYDS